MRTPPKPNSKKNLFLMACLLLLPGTMWAMVNGVIFMKPAWVMNCGLATAEVIEHFWRVEPPTCAPEREPVVSARMRTNLWAPGWTVSLTSNRAEDALLYRGRADRTIALDVPASFMDDAGIDNIRFDLLSPDRETTCAHEQDSPQVHWVQDRIVLIRFSPWLDFDPVTDRPRRYVTHVFPRH